MKTIQKQLYGSQIIQKQLFATLIIIEDKNAKLCKLITPAEIDDTVHNLPKKKAQD